MFAYSNLLAVARPKFLARTSDFRPSAKLCCVCCTAKLAALKPLLRFRIRFRISAKLVIVDSLMPCESEGTLI